MPELTRREIFAAAAAAGLLGVTTAAAAPKSEAGEELPAFRYAMEQQKGKVTEGGSGKEATVKQLPISKGLAGVSMRLKPGGLRELHWHANAAEWAFVVKGRVRTTVIEPDGSAETNDFDPGDVWYFPRGHGHVLQGLGPDECHFILVFDNGAFSEYGTFSITDWFARTPPHVLSRTLGLPESAFEKFPKEELYIVQGRVPPERMEASAPAPAADAGPDAPLSAAGAGAARPLSGGEERLVSAREFPISTTVTGVILDLEPGALREPHWHPHANEWQYYISGKARVGLFGSSGRSRVEEFSTGDAGYIPQGMGHYIENTGDTPCRILIAFDSGEYQEISLSRWLATNPTHLVADNFKIDDATADRFPDHRVYIAPRDEK